MTPLILGAGGMVGRSLCEHFHAANIPFAGLTREEADITKEKLMEDLLEKYHPSIVFNAAALTDVDRCESDRKTADEVNARGPARLAAICRRRNLQLVHLSTDQIFDGQKKAPYREEDPPVPLNYYAQSKLDGEKAVMQAHPGALIVRVSWIFRNRGKTFFAKLRDLLFHQQKIEAPNDRIGNCTYAPDLATAMVAMSRRHITGVVNFTNEGELSHFDFAEEFLETARRVGLHPTCKKVVPIATSSLPFKARRPDYSALDKTRYRKLTGNSIRHWRETLFDFIREKG